MAKQPEIVLGEAYASRSASPNAFEAYRARFADHWAYYDYAPVQASPVAGQWHPPWSAMGDTHASGPASTAAQGGYRPAFAGLGAPYAAASFPDGKAQPSVPGMGSPTASVANVNSGVEGAVPKGAVVLAPTVVTAEPEPRVRPSRSRNRAKRTKRSASRPVKSAAAVAQSPRTAGGETVSRSPVAAVEPSRVHRALEEARGARSGTALDIALKGTFTTLNAKTPEQQVAGYISAFGAPLAGLLGKAAGAFLFKRTAGKVASEVGGIGLSMAADKAGPVLGKALMATPTVAASNTDSSPQVEAAPPQVDPYSKMMHTIKDAVATTGVVASGAALWESAKQRLWRGPLPSLTSALSKGLAYNPVTWLAVEGAAKWAYTAATAKTAEERGAGYGGAVGGVLLGAGAGAALTWMGLPQAAPMGVMIGNFLGDQLGSAIGGYIGATFFSSEAEAAKGADEPAASPPQAISLQPQDGSVRVTEGPEPVMASTTEQRAQSIVTPDRPLWPPRIPSPSLVPGIAPLPPLDIQIPGHAAAGAKPRPVQPRQKPSRPASTVGLPKIEAQASEAAAKGGMVKAGVSSEPTPVRVKPVVSLGRVVDKPSSHAPRQAPNPTRDQRPAESSSSAVGNPTWPPTLPGMSMMPGIAPVPIRFPLSVSLQRPAAQVTVPATSSRLPEDVSPPPVAVNATAQAVVSQPLNFTTHIPITVQGPAVDHDQLTLDLEAAVRSVLEKRQRAEEARLADPLRGF